MLSNTYPYYDIHTPHQAIPTTARPGASAVIVSARGFGFGRKKKGEGDGADEASKSWQGIYAPFGEKRWPKKPEEPCACGSGNPYEQCCFPLHAGKQAAATPEALLRSRCVEGGEVR